MGRATTSWATFSNNLKLEDECWRWTRGHDKDGYGIATIAGVKMPAHRASWILWYTPESVIGQYVLHKCKNRDCCNPGHLYLGNQKQNVQDQIEAGTFVFGSKNGQAVLDEETVVVIRLSNEPMKTLAKRYGVSYATIWDVRNRSWRHV